MGFTFYNKLGLGMRNQRDINVTIITKKSLSEMEVSCRFMDQAVFFWARPACLARLARMAGMMRTSLYKKIPVTTNTNPASWSQNCCKVGVSHLETKYETKYKQYHFFELDRKWNTKKNIIH